MSACSIVFAEQHELTESQTYAPARAGSRRTAAVRLGCGHSLPIHETVHDLPAEGCRTRTVSFSDLELLVSDTTEQPDVSAARWQLIPMTQLLSRA